MQEQNIHEALEKQYRASLEMLCQTIHKCPDVLWFSSDYLNRFWHIAYHALFFTHLYLQDSEAAFQPWERHRPNYELLGATPWPPHEKPKIEEPYSKADVLEYHRFCVHQVEERVRIPALDSPSGFHWLAFSRLELHLYNIRHIQHHAGQLIERLRVSEDAGVGWIGSLQRTE